MGELRQWFQQGLSAHQFALEAARPALIAGEPGVAVSVQRVARSLADTARRAGHPEVVQAANRVAAAEDGELPARLEELLGAVRAMVAGDDQEKIQLLVVEDDPVAARFVDATLDAPNRRLHLCRTVAEAEEVLRRHDIALILLDLGLPDGDGRGMLVRLRRRPRYAAIPIVVISGTSGTQPRTECFALGADEFIGKPFDPRSLAACVAAKLQRSADLTRSALLDPVTGLPNQSALIRDFHRCRLLGTGMGRRTCVCVVRVDRLRWTNDTFGASAGDDVLRHTAAHLLASRRPGDVVGRWGGEEFMILMPETAESAAASWLEHALSGLHQLEFTTADGRRYSAAFSGGMAGAPPEANGEDPADIAGRLLLYLARIAGHRQVDAASHGEGRDRHALLVEDDATMAKLIIGLLRLDGFRVEHVGDGRAALDAAVRTPAGLVVLDVRLPGLDGFEVIREVRRIPGYGRSPILIVSGARDADDVAHGFDLGADDYVVKPFSPIELRARVRRLLTRR